MEHTLYHKLLRVSAVVLALVLLFDGGYIVPEARLLSKNVQNYVASVISVGVSVKPTELNTVTAELAKRNQELDEREAVLTERELAVNLATEPSPARGSDISTYVLSTILFILVVLIVLNYILDYLREKERRLDSRRLST